MTGWNLAALLLLVFMGGIEAGCLFVLLTQRDKTEDGEDR